MLRRVAVLAGRSELARPEEIDAARRAGRLLAGNALTIITTGEALGPAGLLADVAIEAGGRVIGLVLEDAAAELVHPGLTERRDAAGPGVQRAEILALADAVLVLPGAFTDLAEVMALAESTGGQEVPIGLLDDDGSYSALLGRASDDLLDRFVRHSQRGLLTLGRDLADLLLRLSEYRPPETRRGQI